MTFTEVFTWSFVILLIAALVISAIGFYKFVYFISLGYGFSIAGIGVIMLIMFRQGLSLGTILACAVLVVYGLRLGGYLLIREIKSASLCLPGLSGLFPSAKWQQI